MCFPFFLSDIKEAAQTAGHNVEEAVKNKRKKYEDAVREENMTFLPFAMESLGGMSKSCEELLWFIGGQLATVDKTTPYAAMNRLHDKLIFCWMTDLGTDTQWTCPLSNWRKTTSKSSNAGFFMKPPRLF
jgi:hypothetical protein